MNKGMRGVVAILLVFFAITICGKGVDAAETNSADETLSNNTLSAAGDAEWSFLFYLAADNDQEEYADATIDQLLAGTAMVSNHPQLLVFIRNSAIPGTPYLTMCATFNSQVWCPRNLRFFSSEL